MGDLRRGLLQFYKNPIRQKQKKEDKAAKKEWNEQKNHMAEMNSDIRITVISTAINTWELKFKKYT